MSAAYAQDTKVPVDRSRAEIERVLIRFGATGFGYGWDGGKEWLGFVYRNKQVRMQVPIAARDQFRNEEKFQQERRRRWRSLAMIVKAKVVAADDGITSFEDEFLSYFVTPSGRTIGQLLVPRLEEAAHQGVLPPLLEDHYR